VPDALEAEDVMKALAAVTAECEVTPVRWLRASNRPRGRNAAGQN